MPELDRESDVPLSRQLAEVLRARILAGEIPPHRALPSRTRLQQEYGVAAGTVDKALRILKAERLVKMTFGLGHFVTGPEER